MYTLAYLKTGSLPWAEGNEGLKDAIWQQNQFVLDHKLGIDPTVLFGDLPERIHLAYSYIRQLTFNSDPDYDGLVELFTNELNELNSESTFKGVNPRDFTTT
jgi:hypothetical protein